MINNLVSKKAGPYGLEKGLTGYRGTTKYRFSPELFVNTWSLLIADARIGAPARDILE